MNADLEVISDRFRTFYDVSAVNILILVVKCLKFLAKFNDSIKELIEVLLLIIERLIPFLVLLFTILLAYAFMASFFFGDLLIEFETIGTSLRYFVTNIHQNFSAVGHMYQADQTFTIIFMIAFIFIVNFILASMFLIYVTHAYMDYYNEKEKEEALKRSSKMPYDFSPHIVWSVLNFVRNGIPMKVARIFNKKRYLEMKDEKAR